MKVILQLNEIKSGILIRKNMSAVINTYLLILMSSLGNITICPAMCIGPHGCFACDNDRPDFLHLGMTVLHLWI